MAEVPICRNFLVIGRVLISASLLARVSAQSILLCDAEPMPFPPQLWMSASDTPRLFPLWFNHAFP